jgi:hypothetical protein
MATTMVGSRCLLARTDKEAGAPEVQYANVAEVSSYEVTQARKEAELAGVGPHRL